MPDLPPPISTVYITGIILSLLQQEMLNDTDFADVEGLLFGSVNHRIKNQTTDASSSESRRETEIHIHSFRRVYARDRFYDASGTIVVDRYERVAKQVDGKDVLGFFRWRRNTQLVPSLREKAVYQSLSQHTPSLNPPLFMLFTSSMDGLNTISFEIACMVHDTNGQFTNVGLVIANTVESSQLQHEWFVPSTPVGTNSQCNSANRSWDSLSKQYVTDHKLLFQKHMGMLEKAASQMLESEQRVESLRVQVAEMLRNKKPDHQVSRSYIPDSSPPPSQTPLIDLLD
ncbi:hypothetical protein DFS34DRAFT_654497 [Phlyctochytrium arcticum]|nr:hypothetical protein DFS34DRAFT_654497 [Phlyctochytrium arcticum]